MTRDCTITAKPTTVLIFEGGPVTTSFQIRNDGPQTIAVRPSVSVPEGFRARVEADVVHLSPKTSRQVKVAIDVTDRRMPRGTLTLHAGDAYAWLSIFATDNLVRKAIMSANSTHTHTRETGHPIG